MSSTIKAIVEKYLSKTSISDIKRSMIITDMQQYGSVAAATVLEVKFTQQLDDMMKKKMDLLVLYQEIKLDIDCLIQTVRLELENNNRIYHNALITQLIAQSDKARNLMTSTEQEKLLEYKLYAKYRIINNELMISSMAKPSLLKFDNQYYDIEQMEKDNQLSINSKEHIFPYGNGILVNEDKQCGFLVKTSLSEVCRVMMYSEFPNNKPKFCVHAGPAGTGKTETFKEYAMLSGYFPIVTNCSDTLTSESIYDLIKSDEVNGNKILIFDEFNRIPKYEIKKLFQMFNKLTKDNVYMICFTYNPGYLGRTRNIPSCMSCEQTYLDMLVPEFEEIVSVMLAAEGFQDNRHKNKTLSMLLMKTIEKLKSSLSKQCYYDFGLRRIKQITRIAGVLRKSGLSEINSIIEALSVSHTTSYLHKDDIKAAEKILGKLKCDKLSDILKFRHGVMILTKTKFTRDLGLLPEDKIKQFQFPHNDKYNSSQYDTEYDSLEEFYSPEGEFVKAFKENSENNEEAQFMLHNINCENIENLNTVLDDNKTLVLSNGEKIKMSPNLRIILIENNEGEYLPPAIVSRCGIQKHCI